MTPVGAASTNRGNSIDSLRRHNLSTVLTLVHHAGALSRSRLTKATGLNRSTIADLVAELIDVGIVVESDPAPNKAVGRPSPVVRPDPRPVAIAVNPEIDAITVGVVGLGGAMVTRVRHELDRPPRAVEAVRVAAEIVRNIQTEFDGFHRIVGIGVALPGLVRGRDGLVRLAPPRKKPHG